MTLLGFDISHHNGTVNFAAARAASRAFVVIKATDGTGYIDPMFAGNRAAAHAAGLTVGIYHFVEGGATAAETAWFLSHMLPLQPGEFMVLDFEVAYPGDHVAWCKAWLDAVRQATGVAPLIYMNQSEMNAHNWTPISSTYGLWLAKYDNSTAPPAVSSWAAAAMKQYSDKGSVLGVAGGCDVNVFYGDAAALAAYGSQTLGGLTVADINSLTAQLDAILFELRGPGAQGWPTFRWQDDPKNPTKMTLVDYLRSIDREVNGQLDLSGRPGQDKDTAYGQLLSLRADLRAALTKLEQAQAPVIDAAAVAAALTPDQIAAMGRAAGDRLAERAGNG